MPASARLRALEIFRDALELATASRASFLCRSSGDAAVREELAALVEADRQAAARAAEPARVGDYRVERRLGRGGTGTVYLAVRGGARVAVKALDGRARAAWRHECRILAALDHPNVVRLLDHGTTPEGSPYLVTEHVDGAPIDRHCDEGRLSVGERLELFRGVVGAVRYAHERRVIHRDLKPSNVLVTRGGVPKLLDFGIAKLLPRRPRRATTLGRRRMTLEYASPEQASGAATGAATDVYSLGVLLYELLTGHWPYRVAGASGRSGSSRRSWRSRRSRRARPFCARRRSGADASWTSRPPTSRGSGRASRERSSAVCAGSTPRC